MDAVNIEKILTNLKTLRKYEYHSDSHDGSGTMFQSLGGQYYKVSDVIEVIKSLDSSHE